MYNYQSVLFKVLQIIYDDVKVDNRCICMSAQLKNIIDVIYDLPEHFVQFIDILLKDIELTELDNILSNAILVSEKSECNHCVDCKKCISLFYVAIAEKFITVENGFHQDVINKWASQKLKFKDKYGNFNFVSIPPYIHKHLISKDSIYDFYRKQQQNLNKTKDISNSIIMLKGMSSSSPYLYNGIFRNEHFTGGGIYINYNNIGIVIDPGYGFVENMNKNKIFIDDIDIVIITHFHIDHTNDIRLLDDLNRSINSGLKDFETEDDYARYKDIWEHKLQSSNQKPHKIKWYVDTHTEKNLMYDFNRLINEIYPITEFENFFELANDIKMCVFHTKHIQQNYFEESNVKSKYKENTFGFTIEFDGQLKGKIGYTSDTAYMPELSEYLKDSECIIANISGIYEDDYLDLKHKDRHLGYSGCRALLNTTNAKLFVLSEFWNGVDDLRFDVCKSLSNECERKVIPGEIGLQISLRDYSVRCAICGNYTSLDKIQTIAPIGEMKNIIFSCENCRY